MVRVAAILIAAAAVSGCAAQVMSTSPQTVTVRARLQDVQQAQDLATGECAKHGRQARMAGRPTPLQPTLWAFDCV